MLPQSLRAIQDRCRVVTAAALARGEDGPRLQTGWPDIDDALGAGLPTGLHEWFGAPLHDNDPRAGGLPPFCILIHLAWRLLEQSRHARWTVWITADRAPYAPSFRYGDANDSRLLRRTLFVTARDGPARQWATDMALRCPAVHAVIADGGGFNRAATRRLHLLARSQEKWAWLIRPPSERGVLSAALTRWEVCWSSDAPGKHGSVMPGWRLSLLRCKGVPTETFPTWELEWDHAKGALHLSSALAGASGDASSSAKSLRRQRSA